MYTVPREGGREGEREGKREREKEGYYAGINLNRHSFRLRIKQEYYGEYHAHVRRIKHKLLHMCVPLIVYMYRYAGGLEKP